MDIVNKAIARASDLASEAGWNAQQRVKISTEERRVDDLRGKTMAKRAEIGEAMFQLWQAHKLPPSQLDGLFYELQDLIDAVTLAVGNVDSLKAETYEQATTVQARTESSYAAAVTPPLSPLGPAAERAQTLLPQHAAARQVEALDLVDNTPAIPLVECPNCHSMARADRNFCGHCGQQLH